MLNRTAQIPAGVSRQQRRNKVGRMPGGAKPDGEKGGREDEGMVVAVLNREVRERLTQKSSRCGALQ